MWQAGIGWSSVLARAGAAVQFLVGSACSGCPTNGSPADSPWDGPPEIAEATDTDAADRTSWDDVEDGAGDRFDGDDAYPRDDADGPDAEAEDADAGGDCPYRMPGETRAGALPGVTCRRISVPEVEHGLLYFAADGDRIVLSGGVSLGFNLEVDRVTGCYDLPPAVRTHGYITWDGVEAGIARDD